MERSDYYATAALLACLFLAMAGFMACIMGGPLGLPHLSAFGLYALLIGGLGCWAVIARLAREG